MRNGYLHRGPLAAWLKHARALPNSVIFTHTHCLLLPGANAKGLPRCAVEKWTP